MNTFIKNRYKMGNWCSQDGVITSASCVTYLSNNGYSQDTCYPPASVCTNQGEIYPNDCTGDVAVCAYTEGQLNAYCGPTSWDTCSGISRGDVYSNCGSTRSCQFVSDANGCITYKCLAPTPNPTKSPTNFPTLAPTPKPTNFPTLSPTSSPTKFPTLSPSVSPSSSPSKSPTTPSPTNSPTLPTIAPTHRPTQSNNGSCDLNNNYANICGKDHYCGRTGPSEYDGYCLSRLAYNQTCYDWMVDNGSPCKDFYVCRQPTGAYNESYRCIEPSNHGGHCDYSLASPPETQCLPGLDCVSGDSCSSPSGAPVSSIDPNSRLGHLHSCDPNAPWPKCNETTHSCKYFENTGNVCALLPTQSPTLSPTVSPTVDCYDESFDYACGITVSATSYQNTNFRELGQDESYDVCWNTCLLDAQCSGFEYDGTISPPTCFFFKENNNGLSPSPGKTCFAKSSCYPTNSPTFSPTKAPSLSPTLSPTLSPSLSPSLSPTTTPTAAPTVNDCFIVNQNFLCSGGVPLQINDQTSIMESEDQCNKLCRNNINCVSYDRYLGTCRFFSTNSTLDPTNEAVCRQKNIACHPTAQPTKNPTVSPSKSPTSTPTLSPTNQPTVATGQACNNSTLCENWLLGDSPNGGYCSSSGFCSLYKSYNDSCTLNEECCCGLACQTLDGQKRCRSPIVSGEPCSDDQDCEFSSADPKKCAYYNPENLFLKRCHVGSNFTFQIGDSCFNPAFTGTHFTSCPSGSTCEYVNIQNNTGYYCSQTAEPTVSPTTKIPTPSPVPPTFSPTMAPTNPTPAPVGSSGDPCTDDSDCASLLYCHSDLNKCYSRTQPDNVCSSSVPCYPNYFCGFTSYYDSISGTPRICVAQRSSGQTCVEDGNCLDGLTCNALNYENPDSRFCTETAFPTAAPTVLLPGELCDPVAGLSCVQGSSCVFNDFFNSYRCSQTPHPTPAPIPTPAPTFNYGELVDGTGTSELSAIGKMIFAVYKPSLNKVDVFRYYKEPPCNNTNGCIPCYTYCNKYSITTSIEKVTSCTSLALSKNNDEYLMIGQDSNVQVWKSETSHLSTGLYDFQYNITGLPGEEFGYSVAVSGDLLVVGAPEANRVYFSYDDWQNTILQSFIHVDSENVGIFKTSNFKKTKNTISDVATHAPIVKIGSEYYDENCGNPSDSSHLCTYMFTKSLLNCEYVCASNTICAAFETVIVNGEFKCTFLRPSYTVKSQDGANIYVRPARYDVYSDQDFVAVDYDYIVRSTSEFYPDTGCPSSDHDGNGCRFMLTDDVVHCEVMCSHYKTCAGFYVVNSNGQSKCYFKRGGFYFISSIGKTSYIKPKL